MSQYPIQKPAELMSPYEKTFDWCIRTAFECPAWPWLLRPLRKLLLDHPVRILRVLARISPWLFFPYTLGAAAVVGVLALCLFATGLLAIYLEYIVSWPTRVRAWWLRQ